MSRTQPETELHDFIDTDIPLLSSFNPVTESELCKVIQSSNSKYCSLDPLPTSLLKECLDPLLPILCKIVNKSLQSSVVPNEFKNAVVTPLLKKKSLDSENMRNYRPVSNLPYMSKILEKLVMSRLDQHFDEHNLREVLQSAYRAGHSTETALIKVLNDCLQTIDQKKCVLLLLLDLMAALDTINSEIMLSRLENLFGVTGEAKEWLQSYFKDRFQTVVVENTSSAPKKLSTGVPQGSVAGPSVFTAYTRPLGTIAHAHGINLHLYADDTQLYIGCDIDETMLTQEKLEACVTDVRNGWLLTC